MMTLFEKILTACVPIIVALLGILPTLIASHSSSKKSMNKLQDTLDKHIQEDAETNIKNIRYRILRFNDDLCSGIRHSESCFEDILEDIDDYEKYCAEHPNFKNSRGKMAMEHIKETYAKLKNRGEFLI